MLKGYQAKRLTGFTHPDSDPAGATYNVPRPINAVGAGGVKGRGVAGATQTKLNFLPEHATDFAFASLAEQRGFVGVSVLLLLGERREREVGRVLRQEVQLRLGRAGDAAAVDAARADRVPAWATL